MGCEIHWGVGPLPGGEGILILFQRQYYVYAMDFRGYGLSVLSAWPGKGSSKITSRKHQERWSKSSIKYRSGLCFREILRASEKGQEAFIEKFYEVAAVREVVMDYGGKMVDPGSLMFKFRSGRFVNIKVSDADKDQLLAIAAEDVIEPPIYKDDPEEDSSEK